MKNFLLRFFKASAVWVSVALATSYLGLICLSDGEPPLQLYHAMAYISILLGFWAGLLWAFKNPRK